MQNYGEVGTSIDTFFDSFTEFIDMCNDAPIPPGSIGEELFDNPPKRSLSVASRREETLGEGKKYTWSGAKNWEEALEFAYKRWDAGREFMLNHKRLIEHELEGITFKKDFQYDVTGSGLLDVPRHLMGMPDPFLVDHENDIPTNDKGRNIVRILFNGTTNAFATPEQMMLKGAMVTSLVELFEANNRRCEVMVGYCLGGYPERAEGKKRENYYLGYLGNNTGMVHHTILIPVKTPGQALIPEQMFFATACPVMQRRLIFSFQERYIKPVRLVYNYDMHYGMVRDFVKDKDEWDIIVPATVPMTSQAQWKKWLLEKIREQGIEVVE